MTVAKFLLRAVLAATTLASPIVAAQPAENRSAESKAEPAVRNVAPSDDVAVRVEGEKRFQANCGRCHQFPHKFSPRVILTVERHMRVRALVTEDDMRTIIRYLTQ